VAREKPLQSIPELEVWIRSGDFAAVTKAVCGLNRNKIPRAELARYANIANRVNQGKVAHRLLQPVIHSEKKSEPPADDAEKIEYAEALRIMGLIEEAKEVLGEINAKAFPLVHLRIAFCLMTQWRYAEAVPHLKSYIARVDSGEYAHKIARVNLAAALIIEKVDDEALALLEKLKIETKEVAHRLLYGNCLELMAQLFVRQRKWDSAEAVLQEADLSLPETRTRYSLYMMKWKAVSKSLQTNSVHPDLLKCRETAIQERDWETWRECDLYIGFLSKDQDLLNRVYFGTPYASYRKRIFDLAGRDFLKSETYLWSPSNSEPVTVLFDLLEGTFTGIEPAPALEAGRLMHRLLILLAMDFYRPLSITNAFSGLFPDEHYSQQGSKNRVSQIVKRLRAWAQKHGDFFSIGENDGNYILKIRPGTGFLVHANRLPPSAHSVAWQKLTNALPVAGTFSKSDLIRILGCSPSSANRILRWSLSAGQCETVGAGPQRKYRLIN